MLFVFCLYIYIYVYVYIRVYTRIYVLFVWVFLYKGGVEWEGGLEWDRKFRLREEKGKINVGIVERGILFLVYLFGRR